MIDPSKLARKHKLCALASLAMVLLAMLPQIHLWIVRGREWNGAYVVIQGDEPYYASYLNALLSGRPRRNDPDGGVDDSPGSPLPESTFSIQFMPPYVIAFVARIFGASASTAMIALLGFAALLASIAMCWLLRSVTGDDQLAAAGTLFVLCLGGMAGGHALLGLLLVTTDLSMPSLPFLRRYQPAASFPLLILFIGLVWHALTAETKRRATIAALLAGATFGLLVFSYLYLWTAAAAWLVCLSILWLVLRPSDWTKVFSGLAVIGIISAAALAPYLYLVSKRPASLDHWQTFNSTRSPDLLRVSEILGALIIVTLIVGISRQRIQRNAPLTLFAASLGLLPLIVFNQQILTGRTMQPYHYAAFVVNYTVLVGLLVTIKLWWKQIPRRALVWVAALSFMWGLFEVGLPSRLHTVPNAVREDQMVPVLLRLKQLSAEDETLDDLRSKGRTSTIIFSPNITVTSLAPSWTSQGTLPDRAGIDFGHITFEERKAHFHMHLYYANANMENLRDALKGNPRDPAMQYYARSALFGHDRIVPALAADFRPIQDEEIENEIRAYQTYANAFSREQALRRPLTYVVTEADSNFDFANIDRWYERDSGERAGSYVLYRVRLKNCNEPRMPGALTAKTCE